MPPSYWVSGLTPATASLESAGDARSWPPVHAVVKGSSAPEPTPMVSTSPGVTARVPVTWPW